MKQVIIVFLFCISTIQVFSQTHRGVRIDGLYQSETDIDSRIFIDTRKFLRFYPDSTVIATTSTGEATDVIKWLKVPFDNQGKYEIKGNKIYFTVTSSNGTVVYNGLIDSENKLTLKAKSLINGHESEKTFYFVKL